MNQKPLNKIRHIILDEMEMDDVTLCILKDRMRLGYKLDKKQKETYKITKDELKKYSKLLNLVTKYLVAADKSKEIFSDDW